MQITWVDVPDEERAQSRDLNAVIEEFLGQHPGVHEVPPEQTRRERAEGTGALPAPIRFDDRAELLTAPGPAGDVPLRVIRPLGVDRPAGAYLHLHGGGWVIGANDQQDLALTAFADATNLVVASVEYRLAPEHPFPAAPDDCEAAARWLIDHAGELATDRLLIGGESAGAHLAVLTLLRLRDRHGSAGAFAAANLVYGCFDLGLTPSVRRWGDRNAILSTPIIEWFAECFTPGWTAEMRRTPELSPLYADLHGLPPARFAVGDQDPLLDDSLFMGARWVAAGNEAEVAVYPDSLHSFVGFPTAIGQRAVQDGVEFAKRALQPAPA